MGAGCVSEGRWGFVALGVAGLAGCQFNATIEVAGHPCDTQMQQCPAPGYFCSDAGTCQPTPTSGTGTSGGGSSTGGTGCTPYTIDKNLGLILGGSSVCNTDSDCCMQDCVPDPYLVSIGESNPNLCETRCGVSADCGDSFAFCGDTGDAGLHCRANTCGWADAGIDAGTNGAYGGVCSDGDAEGTCVDVGNLVGLAALCDRAGTATAGCVLFSANAALLCTVGEACIIDDGGTNFLCGRSCDPAAAPGACPAGEACWCQSLFGSQYIHLGYCASSDGGNRACQ